MLRPGFILLINKIGIKPVSQATHRQIITHRQKISLCRMAIRARETSRFLKAKRKSSMTLREELFKLYHTHFISLNNCTIRCSICQLFTANSMTKTFTTFSIRLMSLPNLWIFSCPTKSLQSLSLRWCLFRKEFPGRKTMDRTKINSFNSYQLITPKTNIFLTIKRPSWLFSTI